MVTYALIHGAGDDEWAWGMVAGGLRDRGHEAIAVALPSEDDAAGWWDYAESVVDQVGERDELVVVAHSLGGFTAPLVCDRVPAELLVLVAAMVPAPGETGNEWWANSGYEAATRDQPAEETADDAALFFHDVPDEVVVEARAHDRGQSETPMREPWPLEAWPEVETRYLLCRDDRMCPAEFVRRMVRERLGVTPDEIDGGHCAYLSRPDELAARLDGYWAERV